MRTPTSGTCKFKADRTPARNGGGSVINTSRENMREASVVELGPNLKQKPHGDESHHEDCRGQHSVQDLRTLIGPRLLILAIGRIIFFGAQWDNHGLNVGGPSLSEVIGRLTRAGRSVVQPIL